jgi:hypothetical protein
MVLVSNKGKDKYWTDEGSVTSCLVMRIVDKMRNACAGGIKCHLTLDASTVIHAMNTDFVVIIWSNS